MFTLEPQKINTDELRLAYQLATDRRKFKSNEDLGNETELEIQKIDKLHFGYHLFKIQTSYRAQIGNSSFIYHHEIAVKLITKGLKQ